MWTLKQNVHKVGKSSRSTGCNPRVGWERKFSVFVTFLFCAFAAFPATTLYEICTLNVISAHSVLKNTFPQKLIQIVRTGYV